jgi:hypothetical protein
VGIEPTLLAERDYAALIDEGYELPLAAALDHDRLVSTSRNSDVRAEDVAARRLSVTDPGRSQL